MHTHAHTHTHTHAHTHTHMVVSRKAKKKQHVHAQPKQLLVCYLQLPTLKFPSAVTRLSWALLLSYYRASTFLACRISKPKMNELGVTIVKKQPFQLLWCSFSYLRLKLDCLDSNSIVTREASWCISLSKNQVLVCVITLSKTTTGIIMKHASIFNRHDNRRVSFFTSSASK